MKEQEINRYWKRVINTMNDGLMIVGTDGSIIMVNEAFEQLTGYTSDEVLGRPCTLLKCDACEKTLNQKHGGWCALFDHEQDIKRRCLVMKKDGSYLPVLKNASILKDENGVALGSVETLTDISELDRLDEEICQLSRQLDRDGDFHGIN
jgi:two-component system response regulator HydG